jgi:hypothetical protein
MDKKRTYFETRLERAPRREILWRTLCLHNFAGLIPPSDWVLDLGAGYGHFVDNVTASRRIAIDTWEGFVNYLEPGIERRVGDVSDLSFSAPSSVNFAFASSLFEYITQEKLFSVLRQLSEVLAENGTLNILQPNYYYAYREYFDN